MGFLNTLLNGLFELILKPFAGLPAWVPLALIAFVSSLGVLAVYKRVSRQDAIERVKRSIHACFYEIRLFNDDLRAIMGAQIEILRYNAMYVGLNMVPLLVMIVPFFLVLAQLQAHFGWNGLEPGESVVVKATLVEDWDQKGNVPSSDGKPEVSLQVPASMTVETASVWIPSEREFAWRVAVGGEGVQEISLDAGDESATKRIYLADAKGRRAPARQRPGIVHELVYPGEDPLPKDGVFQSIEIEYPDGSLDLFGWQMGAMAGMPAWLLVYFVLSMAFAFALKDRFGVTF